MPAKKPKKPSHGNPGTSNKTTGQTVVSFANSGNRSGSQTYSLPNSWSYATGSYTATLNYTLVAP